MRRKRILVPLLLVVALVMSVGYALMTTNLTIQSEATLNKNLSNLNVEFTKASVYDYEIDALEGKDDVNDEDIVVFEQISPTAYDYTVVGLSGHDDSVTLEFEVTNQSWDVNAFLVRVASKTGTLVGGSDMVSGTPLTTDDYFHKKITVLNSERQVLAVFDPDHPMTEHEEQNDFHSHYISELVTNGELNSEIQLNSAQAASVAGNSSNILYIQVEITLLRTIGGEECPYDALTLTGGIIDFRFDDTTGLVHSGSGS